MKWASKIVLIAVLAGLLSTTCRKEVCKDIVPKMSFNTFYQSEIDTNEYYLIFDFSDCDGDVGMEASGRIVDENGEIQTTNFKIELYYFTNNQWNLHQFASEDGLNSKIPILRNSTITPVLEGELEKKLDIDLSLGGHDTIKFRSRILDNAGHYSEWVETPEFVLR